MDTVARDWKAEGKEVARMAARNRDYPVCAKIVAGAVTDVYERSAADILERSAAKASERGLTPEKHHETAMIELLLFASKARLLQQRARHAARST